MLESARIQSVNWGMHGKGENTHLLHTNKGRFPLLGVVTDPIYIAHQENRRPPWAIWTSASRSFEMICSDQ